MPKRVKSFKANLIGFAVLFYWLVTSYNCISYACGPDWTNLGVPPWGIQNVVFSSDNPSIFICGTSRNFQDPNSGGVYKRNTADTTWEFSGLVYHSVTDLKRFDFNSQSLFAATSEGLYRSDDDALTWDLITTLGSFGLRDQVSFAVSPYDSTEWLLGSMELGNGRLYLSRNSGQDWEQTSFPNWPNELTYSSQIERAVYIANGTALCKYNTETDTFETLYQFWTQTVLTIDLDESSQLVFFNSEDTLGRYDELSGEILLVPIPGDGYSYRVLFWPPDSVIIGTQDSLYAVDRELEHWRSISGGVTGAARPWLCSQYLQVVSFSNQLHCRNQLASAADERPAIQRLEFHAYPNPTNSFVTVVSSFSGNVTIHNVIGEIVFTFQIERNMAKSISLDQLSSGVYYFVQDSPENVRTNRITAPITIIK